MKLFAVAASIVDKHAKPYLLSDQREDLGWKIYRALEAAKRSPGRRSR